jgi:hypothetical protein
MRAVATGSSERNLRAKLAEATRALEEERAERRADSDTMAKMRGHLAESEAKVKALEERLAAERPAAAPEDVQTVLREAAALFQQLEKSERALAGARCHALEQARGKLLAAARARQKREAPAEPTEVIDVSEGAERVEPLPPPRTDGS